MRTALTILPKYGQIISKSNLSSIPEDSYIAPIIATSADGIGCDIVIGIPEEGSNSKIFIIAGVLLAVFMVIAVIVAFIVWRYVRKARIDLSVLPKDVRWFYEHYYQHQSSWKEGTSPPKYPG